MNYSMAAPWTVGGLAISGCTNVLEVNLTAPSAGTLVLTATIHVWVEHTTGTQDQINAQVATSGSDCSESDSTRIGYIQDVPASAPTESFINMEGTFVNAFSVTAAGQLTYFLNVAMEAGQSAGDAVSEASFVLVFYPA
jgi:hypothetical protein